MMRHSELATRAVIVGCFFLVASGPRLVAETLELNVMSFNIRYGTAKDGENSWPNRRELVFDVVRSHRPDVLGLQEALRFQVDEILETLPEYEGFGVGRDDGKAKGEHSTILFLKDRFRRVAGATFWLSDTPQVVASKSWGNDTTRVCTWVRLIEKDSELPITVYNVHLDHRSQRSRERAVELVADRIRSRSGLDPFVVLGDFNAAEDNPAIRYLKGAIPRASEDGPIVPSPGLVDPFRVLHPEEENVGTFNGWRDRTSGRKIDFVLTPRWVLVLRAEIVRDRKNGRFPSDHFPVSARIVVPSTAFARAPADEIELRLQSRDPATGDVKITPTRIDSRKLGVVVVDIWNWHWCKTAAARVGSFVPRMNATLAALRELGAQVYLCPTDVADAYVGTPQREAALDVEPLPLPKAVSTECPPPPNGPGCACIARCRGNFGWNAMHPDLVLGDRDLMPNNRATLYTLAKQRGITHLLYMGVHTQVCLLGKDIGLRNMKALGFECVLARDLTDSHPDYDPARGIDPDVLTVRTVAHFERYLCSTINSKDELTRLGKWSARDPIDPVRAAPWGTRRRPHLFEETTTVTLSAPLVSGVTIRYTTDGSTPTPRATAYSKPFTLRETTTLRAQAFRDGEPACVESEFHFVRLGAVPLEPQVALADVTPLRTLGPGHSPSDSFHRFSPNSRAPQKNRSNRGQPLLLGGRTYDRGLGVHAPNRISYRVDPGWDRFVALAGIDENSVKIHHASDVGHMSSVVFRVFLDGKLAAESPIMRFHQPPWRFDVAIPEGAKTIALVAHPTEDGNREDVADWVDAGFVVKGADAAGERATRAGER